MLKKIAALLLVPVLLAGCSAAGDVETLLRAPQLSGESAALQKALNNYLGGSATLKYPASGDFLSPFAFGDWDGDGTDELVVNIDFSGEEEYVILTCYDGAVYANQVVYRGFLSPKADGTFEWSNGAFDNGASRARFENGVLVYDDFAAMSEGSDGNAVYTLNGESIDEAAYSAFLDEQGAKDDLAWTEFSVDAVNAALAG